MIDKDKQRREFLRWVLLLGLYNSHPASAYEDVLLSIAQGMYADATKHEVRREIEYLAERKLAELRKEPSGRWLAKINRNGIDFVEYNMDAEPGIARPAKPE